MVNTINIKLATSSQARLKPCSSLNDMKKSRAKSYLKTIKL